MRKKLLEPEGKKPEVLIRNCSACIKTEKLAGRGGERGGGGCAGRVDGRRVEEKERNGRREKGRERENECVFFPSGSLTHF